MEGFQDASISAQERVLKFSVVLSYVVKMSIKDVLIEEGQIEPF